MNFNNYTIKSQEAIQKAIEIANSNQQDVDADSIGDACDPLIDNDGDGLIDYGEDPGCANRADNEESHGIPECRDGIDNDGDGLIVERILAGRACLQAAGDCSRFRVVRRSGSPGVSQPAGAHSRSRQATCPPCSPASASAGNSAAA